MTAVLPPLWEQPSLYESAAAPPCAPAPITMASRLLWRGQIVTGGERALPEEIPVALTYDGSSHAVMMATPADLEDFAVGFSLCEGVVTALDQIEAIEARPNELGIELRMSIARSERDALQHRHRYLAGPTGCGLCGVESLAEALRPLPCTTADLRISAADISAAVRDLGAQQHLNRQAHALHAAGFARPGEALIVREDVGRHNALDKLAGALARRAAKADGGFLIVSSRMSIEMVQKAATIGAPIVVAVSAPTALAVRACEAAGLTLVAIARDDAFEVFTHPGRIGGTPPWRREQSTGAKKPSEAANR